MRRALGRVPVESVLRYCMPNTEENTFSPSRSRDRLGTRARAVHACIHCNCSNNVTSSASWEHAERADWSLPLPRHDRRRFRPYARSRRREHPATRGAICSPGASPPSSTWAAPASSSLTTWTPLHRDQPALSQSPSTPLRSPRNHHHHHRHSSPFPARTASNIHTKPCRARSMPPTT